jgi:hypothetical protein
MLDFLITAMQSPELRSRVDDVCRAYADDFEANKEQYMGADGCNLRIEAARLALVQLQRSAQAQRNTEEADLFGDRMSRYVEERDRISEKKRW